MKRVLIVGATSAIAGACARLWAEEGAQLFLVARDRAKLEALGGDLSVRGAAQVHIHQMEAVDTASHGSMIEAAAGALGGIDVALIAYGTLPDQAVAEADPAATVREFSVNAVSVIALLTALATYFEGRRQGALAVITSVAGDRGRRSNYVYGSAKAAVSVFCEGLGARLFRSGVSLTDIRPGFVATPMTAGLPLPQILVAQPTAVARRIVAGIRRGADVVYVPAFWWLIMLVIRSIPRSVFKRLNL